ncbi:HAD family hydrolase [Ruminococcus sp.]|uniref:HAD family hydrolase n=1 Tax=Ruminococcus sp. TaxID=41978 RepID=UPI0025E50E53|nr:HAD family hydrolase [Ruminococcus sp.]MBD9050423.1 HAD family hydrolase [Ruminococcus sp.]
MITVNSILEVESYLNQVDGVVFDLDDTLYSEKNYVRSGYRKIAQNYPDIENAEEKLWNSFLKGEKAIDKVFDEARLDEKEKKNALNIYREHMPVIELYTGVSEMLIRIKNKGKKIGIITDGRPDGQKNKIKALKLDVDQVIITDELGGIQYRKPNKKAFELMQNRWKIAFNKMVYIGDNVTKDFIAPKELGMKVIYFKNADGLYYVD